MRSNACYFRRDKNVVFNTKNGQLAFSERQQQLVNSKGSKRGIKKGDFFPWNFKKFESSSSISEQTFFLAFKISLKIA